MTTKIYVNKIEDRITFEFQNEHYLEFLTPETMKLFESTENKTTKNENLKTLIQLEILQVVLTHRNILNINYQYDSRFSCTFAANKLFGQLLFISPESFMYFKNL